ncbi:TRAP-type C4-dicarboxylate transport system, small permease component [Halobacillus karajensis]|uniref:TRAP transporter small permease n=1 Tax=Halobacillus karajensis TaxID=195088 RepID=UPI0008A7CE71|nr:TRAP transporter small permease [Halobacillus karajensis]SEH50906.1 TRAP-type C4-dicarboxylate transport system, small permease component [Halobacillus karajensis]
MKAVNVLSRLLKLLTIVTFTALVIVVLIQIIGRYSPFSFVWTEELSRFLFIYAIAFSAPIAMEKREYVRVDLFLNFLPGKFRKYYDAVVYFIIGSFSVFLISHSYDFALLGRNQSSATLAIEMYYINLSMMMTFVLLSFYSFLNIYAVVKGSQKEGVQP